MKNKKRKTSRKATPTIEEKVVRAAVRGLVSKHDAAAIEKSGLLKFAPFINFVLEAERIVSRFRPGCIF